MSREKYLGLAQFLNGHVHRAYSGGGGFNDRVAADRQTADALAKAYAEGGVAAQADAQTTEGRLRCRDEAVRLLKSVLMDAPPASPSFAGGTPKFDEEVAAVVEAIAAYAKSIDSPKQVCSASDLASQGELVLDCSSCGNITRTQLCANGEVDRGCKRCHSYANNLRRLVPVTVTGPNVAEAALHRARMFLDKMLAGDRAELHPLVRVDLRTLREEIL